MLFFIHCHERALYFNVSYGRCNNRNRIHAQNLKYDRDVGRTGKRQYPFCQTHRNKQSVNLEYNTLAKHATMCDERDTWSIEDPSKLFSLSIPPKATKGDYCTNVIAHHCHTRFSLSLSLRVLRASESTIVWVTRCAGLF